MESGKSRQIELPIEFKIPEGVTTVFATNMVVQHEPGYFILTFYQVIPPILTGSSDTEKEKELTQLKKIEGRCVARVIVPADKMEGFLLAQKQNLINYRHRTGDLSSAVEKGNGFES